MQDIGFLYLPATVIGGGLLDDSVELTQNYAKEKARVNRILRARYAVEEIPDAHAADKDFLAGLLKKELNNWWADSRYNVKVAATCDKIMAELRGELQSRGRTIWGEGHFKIRVSRLTYDEFTAIQHSIKKTYPGLISFYEPARDD